MTTIAVLYAVPHNTRSQRVVSILDHYQIPYKLYTDIVWKGLGSKLEIAYRATQELTDYTHLLFLDAYDIVVMAGLDAIMERYQMFQHPWVCNADPFIWPPSSLQPEDYPLCESVWRYLNSGAYLAERTYLAMWLERWGVSKLTRYNFCDQGWLASHYVKTPESICLDTQCRLFQCLIGGWWAFDVSPCHLHNHETNTDPLIAHHNGGGNITEERVKPLWDFGTK